MTPDTIFDLASLTKVVATTTAVLQLRERGALSLDEPVRRWLPELSGSDITVRQLLTHSSGLPADNALERYEHGHDAAIAAIARLAHAKDPVTRYEYSDLGFILLGELVERVAHRSLAAYARDEIFEPLSMNDTGFSADARRAAPTEDGLRGAVHDPRAARLGGVAGHAGLFSTADDLARFARYLLGANALSSHPVLKHGPPRTIVSFGDERRGLGWDVPNDPHALAVSPTTFGHTGFTGTALWIDPERDAFIVFLSSRLYPKPHGKVQPLVWQLFAAASLPSPPAPEPVLTGIDVLVRERFARLAGARVGLVTHAAGRARDGQRTLDLLAQAPNLTLVAAFGLEHGLGSDREGPVESTRDQTTELPIYSLYGATRRPTPEMLRGIDTLARASTPMRRAYWVSWRSPPRAVSGWSSSTAPIPSTASTWKARWPNTSAS
jgi:CubicO group peptidase (beta-lactamase class C family)